MKNVLIRYIPWLLTAAAAAVLLKPAIAEFNTFLLIVLTECLALSLSGFAVFVFTKLDLIETGSEKILSSIFLGVHICTGLCIVGFYFAQF